MKKFLIILSLVIFVFIVWQFLFRSADQAETTPQSAPVSASNTTTVTLPILEKEESKQTSVSELQEQSHEDITTDETPTLPEVLPESAQDTTAICVDLSKEVEDILSYLGQAKYLRNILEEKSIKDIFTDTLTRLAQNPPTPVGEGKNPNLIVKNIFHFFRQLDALEINTIKSILKNESEDIEFFADTMFRWLTIGKTCLNPHLPESFEKNVLYTYACFFLDTTGGRAYLSRQTPSVRQLATYYSILAVCQADKEGHNIFAVDIVPHITALILEIKASNALYMKEQYDTALTAALEFYALRRSSIN